MLHKCFLRPHPDFLMMGMFLAGDPDVIAKVPGRKDVNYLSNWMNKENLQLLHLL